MAILHSPALIAVLCIRASRSPRQSVPAVNSGAFLAMKLSDTLRRAIRIDGPDAERKGPRAMNIGYHSLWGVLILAGDIWAIINIFQSSASNEKKLIWTLAVVLLPVLGLILWYFLGPRDGKA
jgi:hypothetical protein